MQNMQNMMLYVQNMIYTSCKNTLYVTSVKLHVSIGKYWVSLYVLVCMVVCIVERENMHILIALLEYSSP